MGDCLTVQTIANFALFKGQNIHFAPKNTVSMFSGDVCIPLPQQKVDRDSCEYFLDIKVGFSWMGDARTVPTIANFDHFKSQNTHFAPWITVFMISGDVFIHL